MTTPLDPGEISRRAVLQGAGAVAASITSLAPAIAAAPNGARAYVIAIREEVTDPAGYQDYLTQAKTAFEGVAFKTRAAYGRVDALEGPAPDAVAVIEFPSFEAAQQWYRRPEHHEALATRLRSARYNMMIVNGIDVANRPSSTRSEADHGQN